MSELPVIVTLVLGFTGMILSVLNQNRRFDDLKEAMYQRFDQIDKRFDAVDRRFDAMDRRLERIENKLDNHEQRITRLEEPLVRR